MKKFFVGVLAVIGGLSVLGFAGIVFFAVMGAMAKPNVQSSSVLELSVKGEYTDSKPDDFFAEFALDDMKVFRDLTDAIHRAKNDDRIAGLYVRVGAPYMGAAKAGELRDAIRDFRATGKWAYAYLETAGEWSSGHLPYYIATACDSVFMAPPGDLNLTGMLFASTFIRGTLDKLGIYPDLDHIGQYKAAKNSVTEKSYTAPHREMMTQILESFYEMYVEDLASARGIDETEFRGIMTGGPYTSQEALDLALVDGLRYQDEVDELIEERVGKRKGISVSRYLNAAGRPHRTGKHGIAVIYGTGPVIRGKSSASPLSGSQYMGSTTIGKALRKAADNDRIKAIILRVDSPGGSYIASDLIWREMIRAREKKPVVVSMSDLAGSGGYFVALPAHRILAEPGTITASIGVIAGKMNMKGLYDKLGITKDHVQIGDNATYYWNYQNYTPKERVLFKKFLDRIYMDFTTKVADARDMEWEAVNEVGRGRIWLGRDAVELGLIDELGGMEEAIAAAKELAEIAEDEEVKITIYPKRRSRFELIMEQFGTRSEPSPTLTMMRQELGVIQEQVRLFQMATGQHGILTMPPIEQ